VNFVQRSSEEKEQGFPDTSVWFPESVGAPESSRPHLMASLEPATSTGFKISGYMVFFGTSVYQIGLVGVVGYHVSLTTAVKRQLGH
jgi:hypothetical protein